jgi:hypothetical protein
MRKLIFYIILLSLTINLSGQRAGIIASSNGSVSASTLNTGLLSEFLFNESSGNAVDVKSSITGTSTSITYGQAGKIGNSFSFDGAASKVTITSFMQPTTAMSISFWIKTTSTADGSLMYAWDYVTGSGYYVGYYLGTLSIHLGDGTLADAGGFSLDATINDGSWHQIIFKWDGTNVLGYIDGTNHLTSTWSHTLAYTNVTRLVIMDNGYGDGYVAGNLDCFAMWSKSLSLSEVTQIYTKENSGLTYTW